MSNSSVPKVAWILVGLVHPGGGLSTIDLSPLPFRIGRGHGLGLRLPAASVSREHAEFYLDGDHLRLRDLGSTNGTFLNRERIRDQAVGEGDIIHFADFEFRLGIEEGGQRPTVVRGDIPLPQHLFEGTQELRALMRLNAVTIAFQPIVGLPAGCVIGYEALGRGCYPGLSKYPADLFHIGATLGSEVDLSRLFRRKALELVASHGGLPMLFLNTHPSELVQPGLLESLAELRRDAPGLGLSLEIHEAAVVKASSIRELRAALRELGIGLAYDDFGAGQARLLELGEVPPDMLKFDARFVHAIDRAPESKRRMVKSLVAIARDLGVEPLAECVETSGEAEVCVDLGFSCAQGFHFGRPTPIEQL
jgi:EAL domain-containing protein (putative c-di-GMP-specific phosphodiesterase class I)